MLHHARPEKNGRRMEEEWKKNGSNKSFTAMNVHPSPAVRRLARSLYTLTSRNSQLMKQMKKMGMRDGRPSDFD